MRAGRLFFLWKGGSEWRNQSQGQSTAKEVAEMLDVSVSHAYKVIREANRELSSKGFYVRAGRVSRKYLDSKVYDLCDKTA